MCESIENHMNCCCRGLKGFLKPRILLRIARKPMHGYELLESLSEIDHPGPPDTGGMYRVLRTMEQDGLLISQWETDDSGPAKRIYQLTEEGHRHLNHWIRTLIDTREWLNSFLEDYQELVKTKNTDQEDK